MNLIRTLVGLVLIVALLAIAADALAQGGTGEIRARINARPSDDGRIEFAFQIEAESADLMEEEQSSSSITWGERILPRGRNFPDEPTVGSWLSSVPPVLVGDVETRIRARRLADGRTEFALQQKSDGENWGENILPSGRYLSVAHRTSHIGRWLNSSVVTLSTEIVIPEVVVPAGIPIVAEAVLEYTDLDGWTFNGNEPSFYYGVDQDPLDDSYFTYVVKVAKTDDNLYETMRIQVSCRSGTLEVLFWELNLPYQPSDRRIQVSYRFDTGDAVTETWHHYSGSDDGFYPPDSSEFAKKLQESQKLVIRARFFSQSLTATFTNVNQLLRTKVQPNIEYCGHY